MAKIKKAQAGDKLKATRITNKPTRLAAYTNEYSVDTSGYAAGKKKFPGTKEVTKQPSGSKTKKDVKVKRSEVDKFIKEPIKVRTNKAQSGDSLTYKTTGRYAPKQRVAIDTAGYASGKKEFTATSELSKKPRKVGRKIVDRTIGAMKAGKIKKAQWGSSEGGRCGISRAAAKDARKSERDYAKQSRQAEREQKREVKAAARQAKRTPSMGKGGNISKKKK
jgi:hypothetical protein